MQNAAATYTVRQLTTFLNTAESQWLAVYDSSSNGAAIVIEGDEYRRLPLRYSTREKILAYFRRCWSPRLSEIMLCNLMPISYKGRLYEIVADPGPVPYKVVRLQIINQSASEIRVRAVLTGSDEGNTTIRYTLSKSGKSLSIAARSDRTNDYRYAPCSKQ
ncbi:DL-endopeptidase inhibitor IseA family protein [Cohnella boryungensis]|uniref:DL-endopeptidase inhibitor IseA family protein n=1 Tax=Cohnella boryungensis TaxID=768479 RepID=A0ABV8S936_9BACL